MKERLLTVLAFLALLGACSSDAGRPGRPGPEGVIGRGAATESNVPWDLTIRVDGDVACLTIKGTGCTPIPDGDPLLEVLFTDAGRDADRAYTCAYRVVAHRVAEVNVLFEDGLQMPAKVFDGTGWQADFFAVCRGDDAVEVESVDLFDSGGRLLETVFS